MVRVACVMLDPARRVVDRIARRCALLSAFNHSHVPAHLVCAYVLRERYGLVTISWSALLRYSLLLTTIGADDFGLDVSSGTNRYESCVEGVTL